MAKTNGNHEQLAVAPPPSMAPLSQDIENVLIQGDLSRLTPDQCVAYYNRVCRTLGLNPYTKPFAYINLNGKKVLYALKDCTDQLRKIHGVSVDTATHTNNEVLGIYVVSVEGHDRDGRKDAGTGVVNTAGLKGDALANAIMKAETKAKRRFTLSICGLGMLDETEMETIPRAVRFQPQPQLEQKPVEVEQKPAEQVDAPKEEEKPVERVEVASECAIDQSEKEVLEYMIAAETRGELNKRFLKFYQPARKNGDTELMKRLYEYKEIRDAEFMNAAKGN